MTMASDSAAVPKHDPKQIESSQKNKRVDWKKQKELEEARKAGTAPPEVDEEGRYNYLISFILMLLQQIYEIFAC